MAKPAWLAFALVLVLWGASFAFTIHELQHERQAAIHRACEEVNLRHRRTVATLDRVWARAEAQGPKARAEVAGTRQPTLLIIGALAPEENCNRRVTRLTH